MDSYSNLQAKAQSANAYETMTGGASGPRELRITERADGILTGMAELANLLSTIQDRVSPLPQATGEKVSAPIPGHLNGLLSQTENVLKVCLSIANQISSKL